MVCWINIGHGGGVFVGCVDSGFGCVGIGVNGVCDVEGPFHAFDNGIVVETMGIG